jgi:hypothetical protein
MYHTYGSCTVTPSSRTFSLNADPSTIEVLQDGLEIRRRFSFMKSATKQVYIKFHFPAHKLTSIVWDRRMASFTALTSFLPNLFSVSLMSANPRRHFLDPGRLYVTMSAQQRNDNTSSHDDTAPKETCMGLLNSLLEYEAAPEISSLLPERFRLLISVTQCNQCFFTRSTSAWVARTISYATVNGSDCMFAFTTDATSLYSTTWVAWKICVIWRCCSDHGRETKVWSD